MFDQNFLFNSWKGSDQSNFFFFFFWKIIQPKLDFREEVDKGCFESEAMFSLCCTRGFCVYLHPPAPPQKIFSTMVRKQKQGFHYRRDENPGPISVCTE